LFLAGLVGGTNDTILVLVPLELGRTDLNLLDQRTVNRTSRRDLEELRALLVGQLAVELEPPLNWGDVSFFRFAFSAVNGVDPRVTQEHR
jgi:hypothetical protein